MDSDDLGFGTCIRCNIRDELVRVCGERGCVIAVHENCMGCDAKFDASSGKFRCPFCEQKLALARVKEARRKVVKAKRALSRFLDGDKARKNQDLDRVVGDIEIKNQSMEEEKEIEDDDDDDDDEKRENEDFEGASKRVSKDNLRRRTGKKENLRTLSSSEKPSTMKKSPVSRQKAVVRTQSKFQAANVISITNFPQEKRKRLHWSEEEEEMLTKGVQECSNGKGNLRWIKILEYGRSVFHETRVPGDLKDKWRGMMVKDGIRPRR